MFLVLSLMEGTDQVYQKMQKTLEVILYKEIGGSLIFNNIGFMNVDLSLIQTIIKKYFGLDNKSEYYVFVQKIKDLENNIIKSIAPKDMYKNEKRNFLSQYSLHPIKIGEHEISEQFRDYLDFNLFDLYR